MPPKSPSPTLTIGEQVMAKMPALNAQWEVCKVTANPNDPNMPLIEFPDGSLYTTTTVEIGGKVAPATPEPIPTEEGQLKHEYSLFQNVVVKLNAESERLFNLPIDVLLIMVQRYAMTTGLSGSGKMGVFSGLSQFVPDSDTFSKWVEAYLVEIERRQSEAKDAELG